MLEDSGETGCNSKTSCNFENEVLEENDASSKFKDGGSSSESTLEESEKIKPCVRPYVRSKMARLRWTPELHLRFVHAVERLGGQDRATPKLVLQMMNIKGLSIAHVKSHLQMFRSKKTDDQSQGIGHHHKLFMEGGDPNIFNMIQFPRFPTYHQRLNSTFRYGDASWNCHGNWMPSNTMGQMIPSFINETSTIQRNEIKDVTGSSIGSPSGELTRLFHIASKAQARAFVGNGITSPPNLERTITPLKRKVSYSDQVDLNLYLGVKPRNGFLTPNLDDNDNDNGSSLSLSLSSPLSYSRATRFIEDANIDGKTENARRGASTLDLTL
ncbi:putative two-component response regulator ARR21 [Solanum pennellii]|uniref:Two-component response regulator ARR21 n=1 Tax=Solanum pennellii TaxID=28526 RepID=A0ABM1HLL5_SOLPN|nr:putative two-component response regulator ARR21 [Solanum pennellii]